MREYDRLPLVSSGRVEGSDGAIEGHSGPNIRPQSSIPDSLYDLNQLPAIGLDYEINRETIRRTCFHRTDDGHEYSSGLDQGRRPFLHLATNDIEDQIHFANVF